MMLSSRSLNRAHFLFLPKPVTSELNESWIACMLTEGLLAQNFKAIQAVGDADSTIISNALQLAQQSRTAVIVVGEDVTAAAPASSKIYLPKPEKDKQADMFYGPLEFKYFNKVTNNIFILHAFGGCDSTSVMFGQEKIKFFKTLEKNIHLQKAVTIFSKADATQDKVDRASQQFIATSYSGFSKMFLNEIRYGIFSTALVKTDFNLANLPPTEAAA
ncbi:hypothetical protein ILUMI_19689 [Ignelater luminosus]|uniref:Uncharacterized protein n=1 Tax=Ignelater luminosus TaxID=2038154 RepID=A0A8K0G592_IGNLU|nr:hypothetical protein ILUMI_19689 [Ignelater luminosus]